MKKRIITSILAITMIVTMIPMTSFGAAKAKEKITLSASISKVGNNEAGTYKDGEITYNVREQYKVINVSWKHRKIVGKEAHTIRSNKVKYQLYRKLNNGKYKKILTTKSTCYRDSSPVVGKHSYKVRSFVVKKGKNVYSKYSNIKSVTFTKEDALDKTSQTGEDMLKRETIDGKTAKDYADMFTEKWYGLYQDYLKTTTKKLTSAEKLIVGKSFNSLSDIQKVYALSQFGYFAGTSGKPCGNYRMVYGAANDTGIFGGGDIDLVSDTYRMKYLYDGKIGGVCGDFATTENKYFKLMGIGIKTKTGVVTSGSDAKYVPKSHAWTIITATNSDGKEFCFPFDYKMQTTSNCDTKKLNEYLIKASKTANDVPSDSDIY